VNTGADGFAAVPAVYVGPAGSPGPVLVTLTVDGETFAVREAFAGGTYYDWITGRNPGYGFSTSAPADQPDDEHRRSIRAFLDMIDPATGYIADE
jgi:hypothetical protein